MTSTSLAARGTQPSATRVLIFGPPSLGVLLTYLGKRWKLWSEHDSSAQIAHSDPAESYTAACFGGQDDAGEGYVAMGCASGRVQTWGPRSGELVGPVALAFNAIARGADCAVSSLTAPNSRRRGATVFAACAGLPEILEVGVSDGTTRASFRADKVGVFHLAAGGLDSEYLLSAGSGSSLKLWALSDIGTVDQTLKPRRHLAASGNAPSCLDVIGAGDGKVLTLCCDGALQIDIFSCDGQASKSILDADLVLAGQDRIWTAKFFKGKHDSGDAIVAGSGPASASLWTFPVASLKQAKKSKTVPALLNISADLLGGNVLNCRTAAAASESSPFLLVSHGAGTHPLFAEVRPGASKDVPAIVKKMGAVSSKVSKEGKIADSAAPTLLGAYEAGAATARQLFKRAAEVERESGVMPKKKSKIEETPGAEKTGALSFAPIVRQGLRSKDSSAMDQVLMTKDKAAIDCTVSELSGAEAFDLLQECTSKLLATPGNGATLNNWIKRVLIHHCAFIGSQPRLKAALGPLKEALASRLSLRRSLVRMRGRVRMTRDLGTELLKARELAKQGREMDTDTKRDSQTPLVEYVEGHSDAEDDEDEDDDQEEDEEEEDDCDIWDDESDGD